MKKLVALLSATMATAVTLQVAEAQDAAPSLEQRFGARAGVIDARLSPSGQHILLIAPDGEHGEMVLVSDLSAAEPGWTAVIRNDRPLTDLRRCDWAGERHLICTLRATTADAGPLLSMTRLVSVDVESGTMQSLTARQNSRSIGWYQDGGEVLSWKVAGGSPDTVVLTRYNLDENNTGTNIRGQGEGLGVETVQLSSMRRRRTEPLRSSAAWYLADETGAVRLVKDQEITGTGYVRENVNRYQFRMKGEDRWRPLQPGPGAPADFSPVAINGAADLVYGFGSHEGHDALFSLALDGTGTGTLLLAQPGNDVDQLIRLGNGGRVVGASYATEKRQLQLFDPELRQLIDALRSALPGTPLIEVVDASEDESRLLLIASSDVDPGMVYLFDKASRQLSEVMPMRAALADLPMGTMKPVSYPAADGTMIPAYLTLPPGSDGVGLPAIVLPHGGPSARDEWGFDWLVQYLVHRGYAVLQPNFRGSAGYGSAWFQRNGFQSWETAVGDVNAAGRWLVETGVARGDQLAIVGWSYGGYAALQSPVLEPDLFRAIVAIASVTDLAQLTEDARTYTSFRVVRDFVGTGPHIAAGSPARHADRFRAPVLLFHGTVDENVDVGHSRSMAGALRRAGQPVDYVEYAGLDHFIDHPAERSDMLRRIDEFLAGMKEK